MVVARTNSGGFVVLVDFWRAVRIGSWVSLVNFVWPAQILALFPGVFLVILWVLARPVFSRN